MARRPPPQSPYPRTQGKRWSRACRSNLRPHGPGHANRQHPDHDLPSTGAKFAQQRKYHRRRSRHQPLPRERRGRGMPPISATLSKASSFRALSIDSRKRKKRMVQACSITSVLSTAATSEPVIQSTTALPSLPEEHQESSWVTTTSLKQRLL